MSQVTDFFSAVEFPSWKFDAFYTQNLIPRIELRWLQRGGIHLLRPLGVEKRSMVGLWYKYKCFSKYEESYYIYERAPHCFRWLGWSDRDLCWLHYNLNSLHRTDCKISRTSEDCLSYSYSGFNPNKLVTEASGRSRNQIGDRVVWWENCLPPSFDLEKEGKTALTSYNVVKSDSISLLCGA